MSSKYMRVGALAAVGVTAFSGVALAGVALATKASLPARTAGDAKALAARESAVAGVLGAYQRLGAKAQVGPWEAKLKAAEGAQAAALAALNRDLGAHPAPAKTSNGGPHVIFRASGSGIASTRPFTIPAADKAWQIDWSYDCASIGSSGYFNYYVNIGTQSDINDFGPNQVGAGGHGVEHYYDSGTFNLQVNSECSWTIQAIG